MAEPLNKPSPVQNYLDLCARIWQHRLQYDQLLKLLRVAWSAVPPEQCIGLQSPDKFAESIR